MTNRQESAIVSVRGSITSFDPGTGNSTVLVGAHSHSFHSTDFWAGSPTRFPITEEQVEVLFDMRAGERLLLGVRPIGRLRK